MLAVLESERIRERAGRINLLPSNLVNQIAAGEVVERPASVVKELVENAIDAGARAIDITIEHGGRRLIEVVDDGSGMSHRDALLALERHATSKLATFEDLTNVRTLGFRGEALPSIASVSRFTMVTWDGMEECAAELSREPESQLEIRPAARDRGTTIRVEELFANVPARRKFLRSADAEFRAIVQVVVSYAIANPDRAFRLDHNGRSVLDLPAAPAARERVVAVLGRDSEEHVVEVEFGIDRVEARGFVTRGLRYGSRRNQYFFVNGRLVRDRVLAHAASRASDAFDFEGHPAVVLFLSVPPELVDVNVHPAKTEVRFRDSGTVHVVVEKALKGGFGGPEDGSRLLSAVAEQSEDAPAAVWADLRQSGPQEPGAPRPLFQPMLQPAAPVRHDATPLFRGAPLVQPPLEPPRADFGDLQGRVIGQYRHSYIIIDMPDGLRLVDQHVAHERVLYDTIARGFSMLEAQRLLTPLIWEPGRGEGAILSSYLEELRALGFEIEEFSSGSFAVSAVPSILGRESAEGFLRKLVDASIDEGAAPADRVRHRVIASLACQAAIKVHRPLSGHEMAKLVADLLASSNPWACPHGRPIIVDIRHLDIEKHFHRK